MNFKHTTQKILIAGWLALLDFIYPERETLGSDDIGQIPPAVMTGLVEPDIHAVWKYRTPMARTIIWKLKYAGSRRAADLAGAAVWQYIKGQKLTAAKNIFLVPIPLSPRRLRERGYNQCEWICRGVLKCSGSEDRQLPLKIRTDILQRINYQERQTHKDRAGRIQNASETFACAAIDLSGDGIYIIIDDVVTTGSTFGGARRALLAAGATRVICIAVAH